MKKFELKKNCASLMHKNCVEDHLRTTILKAVTDMSVDIVNAEIWSVLSDVTFFSVHYSNMNMPNILD